ncbi:DeoR/GlpR family DNA-binding transcription regulator [Ferrimonas balearica]|uniref:DeoR/GlpR family DNA-binding transcription regulator n=1 Tax=Ferrimonas balearica TaxID=44012 RepID=UPI001C9918DC|nr:DeoR/GlpR family DNA-binding transcription regulator [Ferrimonas balearica]MBY5990920.1 DeoR/GlpR family DNA-binding transcription regulator [Ferrimonas balearica]
MIPAERQRTILALLDKQEILTIAELTDRLGVSHMTVRRDIAKLEEKGQVFSVAGGVQRMQAVREEVGHLVKASQNLAIKQALGQACRDRVPPQSTVYLDAGTTLLEVAKSLADRDDLMIITNDFFIAGYLAEHGRCELYHTGGRVDRDNHSCVGELSARFLRDLNIDIAFISASCWNPRGISSPSQDKVMVKRAIARVARQSLLVCDSSKFGRTGTFMAMETGEFDAIISDPGLPLAYQERLAAEDVEWVAVAS